MPEQAELNQRADLQYEVDSGTVLIACLLRVWVLIAGLLLPIWKARFELRVWFEKFQLAYKGFSVLSNTQFLSWGLISHHELLSCSLEMGLWCCKVDCLVWIIVVWISFPIPLPAAAPPPPNPNPPAKKKQRMLWNRKWSILFLSTLITLKESCLV